MMHTNISSLPSPSFLPPLSSLPLLPPSPPSLLLPPLSSPPSSGSPDPGPRYDITSTFIPHSVLAPSESYAATLYKKNEVGVGRRRVGKGWWEDCIEATKHVTFSCPSQMTRPPPVVLPEVRPIEVKEEMTYQRTILVRGGGRVGNSTWRVTSSTLPPSTCTYAWPPSAGMVGLAFIKISVCLTVSLSSLVGNEKDGDWPS